MQHRPDQRPTPERHSTQYTSSRIILPIKTNGLVWNQTRKNRKKDNKNVTRMELSSAVTLRLAALIIEHSDQLFL